jgi:hypothetical protein
MIDNRAHVLIPRHREAWVCQSSTGVQAHRVLIRTAAACRRLEGGGPEIIMKWIAVQKY